MKAGLARDARGKTCYSILVVTIACPKQNIENVLYKAALQCSISLGVSMAKFWTKRRKNKTTLKFPTLQRCLLVIKIDLNEAMDFYNGAMDFVCFFHW